MNVMDCIRLRGGALGGVFNALIIIALVPLALRGVKYRPRDARACCPNLLIYGVGASSCRSRASG